MHNETKLICPKQGPSEVKRSSNNLEYLSLMVYLKDKIGQNKVMTFTEYFKYFH